MSAHLEMEVLTDYAPVNASIIQDDYNRAFGG
jgi:hypothetical protein